MAQNISTSVSTNASSNSGMSLDSKQSINLDRFSDSIRNKNFSDGSDVRNFARKNGLDENAFMEKFNSYNDTFKASNQLGSQLQRTDGLGGCNTRFQCKKLRFIPPGERRPKVINRISVKPPACLKVWFPTSVVMHSSCYLSPISSTEFQAKGQELILSLRHRIELLTA